MRSIRTTIFRSYPAFSHRFNLSITPTIISLKVPTDTKSHNITCYDHNLTRRTFGSSTVIPYHNYYNVCRSLSIVSIFTLTSGILLLNYESFAIIGLSLSIATILISGVTTMLLGYIFLGMLFFTIGIMFILIPIL